jgi:hypothetical protein
METKSIFTTLNTMNLKVSSNQGKKYIPWSELWAELCKHYPTATYEFHSDENGVPFFNSAVGLFVKVSVTIYELTHTMTRPVYNNAFKSMRVEPYDYTIKNGSVTKTVAGANADDVNDALMRCFAKAMAMHGLGLFVFEDKPFADLELIDSTQISEISNLIAKHKLDLGTLNKCFGINRLSELASFNYDSALQWIEDATNNPS